MVIRWLLIVFVCVFGALLLCVSTSSAMTPGCSSIEEKPVKVEAWMSKQYEKNLRQIHNEFSAMGNTRVILWVYPAENPSKIVAIGSCVPSYVGRHMLRQAMEYSGGVNSLVNQGFFFFQLDRSRYVPICGKLSSANHSRPTHYTAKKGKGLWSYVGQPKTIGESLVTPYEADRVRKGFIIFFVQ